MSSEALENRSITVVMPVYNERGRIEEVLRSCYRHVMTKVAGSELVIVEDGSTDGTGEILNVLKEKISFRLITSSRRRGFASAFREALGSVRSDLVFFCDSDGQYDFSDFDLLVPQIGQSDMVSGWKRARKDPFYRVILSKALNGLIGLLFGLRTRDANSSFKLIKREVIEQVLPEVRTNTPCIMAEFVVRARLKGFRIREVPVRHLARSGSSSRIFQPHRLPLIMIQAIFDLLHIKIESARRATSGGEMRGKGLG